MKNLGPIEEHKGVFIIREDLVTIGRANGTKAAVIAYLLCDADGVCTVGARESTQALMTARICQNLGIGCEFHCPTGKSNQITKTIESLGFPVVVHSPGYKTVLNARAKEIANELGWRLIPFGCEFPEIIELVAKRCKRASEWPGKRLVVPVGSGMVLSGILTGLARFGWNRKVLGVCAYGIETVEKRLDKYIPNWRKMCSLVSSKGQTNFPSFRGVPVDPIYSGGCVPFLEEGDLFWNSGARQLSL